MNFVDTVLERLKKSKQKYFSFDQILKICGFSVGFDSRAVMMAVNELEKKDKLVRTARNKYTLSINAGAVKGVVVGTNRSYVFVKPEDEELDDIFVSEKDLHGAIHGDLVLVRIKTSEKRKNGKFNSKNQSRSGEIIKIIERRVQTCVGIYCFRAGGHIVVPDDSRFADCVFIAPDKTMGAQPNQKVVAKIVAYPSPTTMARGEIVEILGDAGETKVETLSILRSFNINEKFPEMVLAEAKKISTKITDKDLKNRTDFRNQQIITIDGADAKDFDDAISLSVKDDVFVLSVHIADVAHYVKEGTEIDNEAFRRGTSVYFPDLVVPMLPEVLCNNICSLKPHEDRLTLSVVMQIDSSGRLLDYKIVKGIINSCFRMTYDQVTKIFEGDKEECKNCETVVPMLQNMLKLSKILERRREKEGSIDFDLPEVQIDVDDNGKTINVRRKPRNDSDKLIEQFMVMANETIAKHFCGLKLPFVYRVHESPTPEKLATFADFLNGLGVKFNIDSETVKPKDFQHILKMSEHETYHDVLSKVMLRSMQKAVYYEQNLGHFGLALKNYCHFTSPIRRYPDLMIHRIISKFIGDELHEKEIAFYSERVKEASEQASLTERNADDVERAVDDQKKAEFMVDKVGQVFEAKISGLTDAGLFVELENTVEGFVARNYLPFDNYIYDDKRLRLVGKTHCYNIGDKVKVKLINVDVLSRHIDFSINEI